MSPVHSEVLAEGPFVASGTNDGMRRRALTAGAAVAAVALLSGLLLCAVVVQRRMTAVKSVAIGDPATYWTRGGFVEMTPPVRLPSQDGKEYIAIWLRLPETGLLRIVRREGKEPTLSYPPGTVADRVDLRDARIPSSVTDVRGTRFDGGQEYFHVLRSVAPHGDQRTPPLLSGVEWKRGDAVAERGATDRMLASMATMRGLQDTGSDSMLRQFERRNDCASCHVHDKPEQRGPRGDALVPNRGTDADGLYAVVTVLRDEAPLETHRARDMNEGDPFVRVTCDDGAAGTLVPGPRGRRHFSCADGSVPRGRLDLPAALAVGDAHAKAVCASRAYLAAHMDDDGRSAFAQAFAECSMR
jgi:hypothetical protein